MVTHAVFSGIEFLEGRSRSGEEGEHTLQRERDVNVLVLQDERVGVLRHVSRVDSSYIVNNPTCFTKNKRWNQIVIHLFDVKRILKEKEMVLVSEGISPLYARIHHR